MYASKRSVNPYFPGNFSFNLRIWIMVQSHVVKMNIIKISPRQIFDLCKKSLANKTFRELLICFF